MGLSVRALAEHKGSLSLISSNNAHTYVHAYICTHPGKGVCARGTLPTLITILSQTCFSTDNQTADGDEHTEENGVNY